MADKLLISTNRNFTDSEGKLTQEARLFINGLINRLPILGNGNPEGVVNAPVGQNYKDLDGTTGSISYFKKLADIGGDTSKGWVLE